MTSAQSAARFFALREGRGAAVGPRTVGRTGQPDEVVIHFREVVTQHIGRCPRGAAAIFADVRDDYGSCCERRLWRTLAWLVATGRVIKTAEGYRRAR